MILTIFITAGDIMIFYTGDTVFCIQKPPHISDKAEMCGGFVSYQYAQELLTAFLIGSIDLGDTESSSTPIFTKLSVSEQSAASSPHIPAHMPASWAASTVIFIMRRTAGCFGS